MKKYLIILILFTNSSFAADSTDFQSWNNVSVFGNFGKLDPDYSKFRYEMTFQYRFADNASTSYQRLYRGALGYDITENHSLWIGGDYLNTHNLVPEEVNLSGFWQQYMYTNKYHKFKYLFRTRFEELYTINNELMIYRIRLMFRGMHPITNNEKWNVIGFNEFFQNLNGNGVIENSTLIQNRAFAGIGYKFNDTLSLETGYMNQYIHNSQGFDFLNNIVLTSLVLNFN